MLCLSPAFSCRRILLLGAHADDIEIGAGGTMLDRMARQPDTEIRWMVFSASAERKLEALASSSALLAGSSDRAAVEIANFRDSFFPAAYAELKEKLHQIAGEFSPDLIVTHYLQDGHQDHRVLSELTHNAFRDHWILEYEIPKFDGDLGNPNLFVPLSTEIAAEKIRILLESFPSQHEKPWFREEVFWAMLRLRGLQCRSASGLAEAFYCRKACLQL